MAGFTYDCYVANLPLRCNENEIREIFGIAGEIVGVKILPAKLNAEGKVAFVKFTEECDAHCCAQYMNNHVLDDGRTLKVRYRPKGEENGFANGVVNTNHESRITNQKSSSRDFNSGHNKVKEEEMQQVFVCHVESPIEFWAQKCTEAFATQLEELTAKMEAVCPTQPKVIGMLSTEQVYGCKFSEDNLWYRCIVEKALAKNEVDVRYIDYGNSEVADRFCLVTLPTDLSNIPPMCERYQVEGLELTTNDIQSEIYEKGLDEFNELINEEKIDIMVKKRDKNSTIVKIYQDADGKLLDIPTTLMPTGSVRVKTVGQASSFATAVKTPIKTTPNVSDALPKANSNPYASVVSSNGTDSAAKSAFNHVNHDSPAKTTFNHAKPAESPVKPTFNHVKPAESPVKSAFNHTKPVESPVKPTFSHIKPVESPAKLTFNHTKPVEAPPGFNHIKSGESPAKTAFNHVVPLESLVKAGVSRNWFSEPQVEVPVKVASYPPVNNAVINHIEPSIPKEIKAVKPGVTAIKVESSETKGYLGTEQHSSMRNGTEQKQRYKEAVEQSTMSAELYMEQIENSTNIIKQLKQQLAEKTNLLAGYLLQTSKLNGEINHVVNGNVESELSTDRVVRSLYVSGNDDTNASLACDSEVSRDDEFEEATVLKVCCKDVGGYKKEMDEMKAILEIPLQHSELFNHFGIKPPRGILLWGPHGTGKTLIARAIANESQVFIKEIFGPSIVSGTIENSNRKLNRAFKQVAKNAPSILIIDQLDVIAPKKESGKNKIVDRLLTLLSQLEENTVIISTAIKSDNVDPVLNRVGLFDKEISISKPDLSARLEIVRILSSKLNLSKGVNLDKISEETQDYVGMNLSKLCTLAVMHGIETKIAASEGINKNTTESLKQITINMADFKHALEVMNSSIREAVAEVPSTTWDDICGMEDVKNELKDLINDPLSYEEKLLDMGGVPSKGVLLCGPHGCGKSLFAKAMSNECKCKFISVKGHDLSRSDIKGYNVADMFVKARSFAPCMLFIDEIELVTPADNLLNDMLIEIDNIKENENVYVIGATSRPLDVHPAFRRSGRLQHIVQIPLPDQNTRKSVLERGLEKKNKSEEIDSGYLDELAERLDGFTVNDLQKILHRVHKISSKDGQDGEIASSHFEEAIHFTRRSVTDVDIKECKRFVNSLTTDQTNSNDKEMVSSEEAEEDEELELNTANRKRKVHSNGAVNNNFVMVLLGLFTIACFIYLIALHVFTSKRNR